MALCILNMSSVYNLSRVKGMALKRNGEDLMSTETAANKKLVNNSEKAFYYIAAMLLPNTFLFFLYNANREVSLIIFNHVLILALALAIISAILLSLSRLVIRNYEGAMLVLLLFWSSFWLFEAIFKVIPSNRLISSRSDLLVVMGWIIIFFLVILMFISTQFYKMRVIFKALAGIICLLFLFNFFPASSANIRASQETRTSRPMKEFNINKSLPTPNIYWFHMDGMLNFTDMEYFFNMPQEKLRQQLNERGFVINEDAKFNAFNTMFGTSALLSPTFHDNYLGALLAEKSGELHWERSEVLHDTFERDDISLVDDIAPFHELFTAFLLSDYEVVLIANYDERVHVPLGHFYRLGGEDHINDAPYTANSILQLELEGHFLQSAHDLVTLLGYATPIPSWLTFEIKDSQFEWVSIPEYNEEIDRLTKNSRNLPHERQLYRSLIDSFTIEVPRLTYMATLFTHASSWDWNRVDLYPTEHEYAGNVMITMIDMILEEDPAAIIVLQADHGFHTHKTQVRLLEDGFSEEEVAHLANSVMSAVRIPQQYGGLAEPLHPLNITRELVNRFVGQNYQLLSDSE